MEALVGMEIWKLLYLIPLTFAALLFRKWFQWKRYGYLPNKRAEEHQRRRDKEALERMKASGQLKPQVKWELSGWVLRDFHPDEMTKVMDEFHHQARKDKWDGKTDREIGYRYLSDGTEDLSEAKVMHFLLQKEREGLHYLLKKYDVKEGCLSSTVQDWWSFTEFMHYRPILEDLGDALTNKAYTEDEREFLLEIEQEFSDDILHLFTKMCKEASGREQVNGLPTAVSLPPLSPRKPFKELTHGVHGMDYLWAAYEEMLDVTNSRESVSPDVVEMAERTLDEIEGLVEARRQELDEDKRLRDQTHVRYVRQSIGLSNDKEGGMGND